jgi:hypothetical protein
MMFDSVYKFFLKHLGKPSIIHKINTWHYTNMIYFFTKVEKVIAWFSSVFDRLHLNKIFVSNKK